MLIPQILVDRGYVIDFYNLRCSKEDKMRYRLTELQKIVHDDRDAPELIQNDDLFHCIRFKVEDARQFFVDNVLLSKQSSIISTSILPHISLQKGGDVRYVEQRTNAMMNYLDHGIPIYGNIPFQVPHIEDNRVKHRYFIQTVNSACLSPGIDFHDLLELTPNLYGLWLMEHDEYEKINSVPVDDSVFELFDLEKVNTISKDRIINDSMDAEALFTKASTGKKLIKRFK